MNKSFVLCLMGAAAISGACISSAVAAETSQTTSWYKAAYRLQADGRFLDTVSHDLNGHASPYYADMDGDGRRDLVVGSFSGMFRLYTNEGTDSAPSFSGNARWLVSGNAPAKIPNFCCVAAGPQMVDIDNDGVLDLTSGSYAPGALYWFKGLGSGTYTYRHTITDVNLMPVLAHPETEYAESGRSYAANIAWVDWNDDGMPDLIIGNSRGELFVRLQQKFVDGSNMSPPINGQPVFFTKQQQTSSRGLTDIVIDGGKGIPDGHAAPSVADWDGDGLFDILVGSMSGSVYLLRNTGKRGAPQFKSCEVLLGPGLNMQWVEPGQAPKRGVRTQIQAVDINGDGKMDLLAGDWFRTNEPRADLTAEERREMQRINAQLAILDRKAGYQGDAPRANSKVYQYDSKEYREVRELEGKLDPYLQSYSRGPGSPPSTLRQHGMVMAYIRK